MQILKDQAYFLYLSLLYSGLVAILPWYARKFKRNPVIAMNLALIIMISGFIGGRAFHVIFESWEIYSQEPIRIFYFWTGGFVFYGGGLAAALSSFYYLKKRGEAILEWFDFFSPILALGYSLGRVSCFIAGCCYGKTCSLPWAIKGLHPTQLYASLWEFGLFILILCFLKAKFKPGLTFFSWTLLHSVGRLIMEYFRSDFRGEFYFGLSISTWISLFIFSASLSMILRLKLISPDSQERL